MTQKAVELLRDALDLADEERAGLAYELLESLGPPPAGDWPDEASWRAEIERRARRVLAGDPGVSWDEARARIESELRSR